MTTKPLRTVLITGVSSGIGLASAKTLLATGHSVMGLSRRATQLDLGDNFHGYNLDLSQLETIAPTLESILKTHPSIDAMISNAGVGNFGELEQFSPKQIQQSLEINLLSHVLVARMGIPHLKRLGRGHFIIMGSGSALRGGRRGSLYSAAKFGLRGLAQSLREECSRQNVGVTLVNPGFVRTPFFDDLDFSPGPEDAHAMTPADVASVIEYILNIQSHMVVDEIRMTPQQHVVKR